MRLICKSEANMERKSYSKKNASNKEQEDKDPTFWESPDHKVTKIVIQEGDRHRDKMQFGATGLLKIGAPVEVHGITLEELTDDFFFSKYFNRLHSGEVQMGNADSEIDRTLETCLGSMRPGEKCRAVMRTRLRIQKNKRERVELKEVWVDVDCELHLESVLNATPIAKWYPETKLEKAKEFHAAAVWLFKTGRMLDAFHKFRNAVKLVSMYLDEGSKEDVVAREEAKEMRLSVYGNMATCQLQWGNHGLVVELASKVLKDQPKNVKMLYQRGSSFLELKRFEEAKVDLFLAHRIEPANKAINDKLGVLRVSEKRHKEKMAKSDKALQELIL